MKTINLNYQNFSHLNLKSWLTNYELAAAMQISYSTIYKYRKAGIIPSYKIDGRVYFSTVELFSMLYALCRK